MVAAKAEADTRRVAAIGRRHELANPSSGRQRLSSLKPISPNGTRSTVPFFGHQRVHLAPPLELPLCVAQGARSSDSMREFLAQHEHRQAWLRSERQRLELERSKLDCALAVIAVAETHADNRAVRARQEEEKAWEGFTSTVSPGKTSGAWPPRLERVLLDSSCDCDYPD